MHGFAKSRKIEEFHCFSTNSLFLSGINSKPNLSSMKNFTKTIALFLFATAVTTSLQAQTGSANSNNAEVGPNVSANSGTINTQALFDVQFNYDLTTATSGSTGCAGIVHLGTQFWVSKWQSDTVFRLDNSGTLISFFNIPLGAGGGIRAMTTDGNFVYASQNGPEILVIDMVTESVVSTIPLSLAYNARSLTYDATANGGAGGFWISNFGTDITLVSMAGASLSSIPAATHTLTGMYGSVIDNISSPTQKLWVFNQPGATGSEIWQIETATGMLTGVTLDANAAISSTTGLAGGICIATGIATEPSLVGLIQDTPNIILGLELPDPLSVHENDNTASAEVFPVPANESINFVVSDMKSSTLQVNVYDVNGKLVKSLLSADKKITISTKEFASGVYTVNIQNGENTIVKKFMVD
jgi:hypothetical protein